MITKKKNYHYKTGPTGVEPATAWLKARRSPRLSYEPQ